MKAREQRSPARLAAVPVAREVVSAVAVMEKLGQLEKRARRIEALLERLIDLWTPRSARGAAATIVLDALKEGESARRKIPGMTTRRPATKPLRLVEAAPPWSTVRLRRQPAGPRKARA